jgi:phage shock protein C
MAAARLMRSRSDRKIAGVAGGIAQYYELDPSLVRILWVVAIVFGGFGLAAYIILWIALPEGDSSRRAPAVRIAEERYARGEISSDELKRIRIDLGGA